MILLTASGSPEASFLESFFAIAHKLLPLNSSRFWNFKGYLSNGGTQLPLLFKINRNDMFKP